MKKKDLNKKLKEIKEKIRANSTDTKLADTLIRELLSTKMQMQSDKLPIYDLGKELGRFEGKTFYIAKYEKAVVYHVYNSIDLVVRPNINALYETLVDYVDNKEEYFKLSGEEKDNFEMNLAASAYVLSLPMYVFTDVEFCYSIAEKVVHFLRTKSEELLNTELKEETPEEDSEFRDAALGIESLKSELEKES